MVMYLATRRNGGVFRRTTVARLHQWGMGRGTGSWPPLRSPPPVIHLSDVPAPSLGDKKPDTRKPDAPMVKDIAPGGVANRCVELSGVGTPPHSAGTCSPDDVRQGTSRGVARQRWPIAALKSLQKRNGLGIRSILTRQ